MPVRTDRSGQRIPYRERLGLLPPRSVRVGEREIRVGRAVVPVDAVTGIELLHRAVLLRAGTSSWLLKTRRPHDLLAALREAVAHGSPTAERLAAATAERTAQPPPDPVLYEERQTVGRLRRSRVVRVCERTLRISGRAPIRLEWISEVRLLDGDEAERAVQERERALGVLVAADRAGDLGARQLSYWHDVLREHGSPDDGGCLWERGLPGAVYLEVEAGASPVHAWLVGSRDPERLHRALADAVAARKRAYGEISLESVGRRPDDLLL